MTPPGSLAELQAIPDPTERVAAANAYIEQHEQAIDAAREIRDRAILVLLDTQGVTAVARAVKMSATHVKNVQRWMVGPR